MSGLFRVYLKRKLEYLDHVLKAFRKIFLQLFVQFYSKSISFHMFQFFPATLAKKFIVGDNMNNGVLLWRLINQHSKWGRLYCFITSHNVLANKSVITYCMHKCIVFRKYRVPIKLVLFFPWCRVQCTVYCTWIWC